MLPADWLETIDRRSFRRRLFAWFNRNARDFPWRRTADPYRVWVAEVMLQQTTTATVAKRFGLFLERFPTVAALAAASEEMVLRAWEGLGYYRRARNIHRAAKLLVSVHDGIVPHDPEVLVRLPGMGKYSANAVATFARNVALPILEANTIRLWGRLTALRGNPKKQPHRRRLWSLAEALLPRNRPRDFNLALMDLGAAVCTPRAPDCNRCPLTRYCRAFQSGRPERFPTVVARPEAVEERHVAVVLRSKNRFLIVRRGEGGRWAGMWEFPNGKVEDGAAPEATARRLASAFAESPARPQALAPIRHGVMHYRVHLTPFLVACQRRTSNAPTRRWATIEELAEAPLSSAHRRIAAQFWNLPVGETRTGRPAGRQG